MSWTGRAAIQRQTKTGKNSTNNKIKEAKPVSRCMKDSYLELRIIPLILKWMFGMDRGTFRKSTDKHNKHNYHVYLTV